MNDQITYLNTAACGLLDEKAISATWQLYQDMLINSSTAAEKIRFERIDKIRETVAGLLKAPSSNIALLPNFSFGLNCIVQSLKGTEKVLLCKDDYPSLTEPFKINKYDITWIDAKDGYEISIDEIKETLLSNKIDLLVISHVQWLTGYKIDIKELGAFCKEHGITYIVDATQSLGAMPIYISDMHADAVIASNYKWMNAGFGTGVMYISDAFLKKYPPVVGGFNSYVMNEGQMQYVPSARSYEPGHTNLHGLLVLEQAILQKNAIGLEEIERNNAKLMQLFFDETKDLNLHIVGHASTNDRAFIVIKADEELHTYLQENNVIVTKRNGTIRVSMHFYNTEQDVIRLCEQIRHT